MSRVAGRQHVAAGPNVSSHAALLSETRLQTQRRRETLNAQAQQSLGSLFTAAQKLRSNEKNVIVILPSFPTSPNYCLSSQWGADPFPKNLDQLQAPFRNMRGSQWDPVIPNINTKPSRTIQCNLILYGAAFT